MHKKSEWWPAPPGVTTLYFVAPTWLFFFIYTWIAHDVLYGVLTLLYGAWAIWCVKDAAYTAGMRKAADAYRARYERVDHLLDRVGDTDDLDPDPTLSNDRDETKGEA